MENKNMNYNFGSSKYKLLISSLALGTLLVVGPSMSNEAEAAHNGTKEVTTDYNKISIDTDESLPSEGGYIEGYTEISEDTKHVDTDEGLPSEGGYIEGYTEETEDTKHV
ncbi:hypothetical protein PQ748_09960, partial [Staphylococcus coagulans]